LLFLSITCGTALAADGAGLLQFVDRSPKAPSQDAWIELFEPKTGMVMDPVYVPGHIGEMELRRFHDTFIKFNKISFVVLKNFADPESGKVVRLVNISVEPKTAENIGILQPCHIIYDVNLQGRNENSWKIQNLKAYWTPLTVKFKGDSLSAKLSSLWFVMLNANAMISNLGLSFSLRHWMGSFTGAVSLGSRSVGQLLIHAKQGDQDKFLDMFENPNDKSVLVLGKTLTPLTLFKKWNGSRFDIVDYQQSGFHSTVYYTRSSPANQRYEGFFLLNLQEWMFQTPRILDMYVVEEFLTS